MKRMLLLAALTACTAGSIPARPHVVGYERFHRDQPTAEGGAILFSELGCAGCHGGAPAVIPRQGPSLLDLSRRVERDWVSAFLRSPDHGRSGSTMPAMFAALDKPERTRAIEEVTAWLGSLRGPIQLKPARHANAERGSALYHEMGCVACHAPTPDRHPGHPASPLAVSHGDLSRKTSLTALADFLAHTDRYRPDGRMPRFPMEAQDSIDLAAHLLDFQSSDPREAPAVAPWPEADARTVVAGRLRAEALGCAACHELPGLDAVPLMNLDGTSPTGRSCLSAKPVTGLPHYGLEEDQRASLQAYLTSKRRDHNRAHVGLSAMNCYACHQRNKRGGPLEAAAVYFTGNEGLGDAGRLPPPLDEVGHKLQEDWLPGVFNGTHRVRPYLKTRMPVYPAHAQALANWLTRLDPVDDATTPRLRRGDLEAGRTLLGTEGGANCITCHRWGERASLGIPGMDLATLDQRLRPAWFRSYLLDPSGYRPGTLMPSFWPEGTSAITDVLDGNTEHQIAAIWQFIAHGDGLPPGFPNRDSREFELVPKDRPIVQRTFLEGVGTKAILVGFPAGIHLAYDGGEAGPALLWQGRFFDAYTTWFSRFAPFESPLETTVHPFPASKDGERRFLGYELDEQGNPTFLIELDGRSITEHFSAKQGALVRTLRWQAGPPPKVAHPNGVAIDTESRAGELVITYTLTD